MTVVKTSDDRIEMTQNQVYGTVATHQDGDPVTAVDKIEMTQNQVYGAAHQDGDPATAVDKIGMTQNQVCGTVAAHQDGDPATAVDKIEMTQNQVYGAAHQDGDPATAVDKIEMTHNQLYGTQNTVAESAARNQPSYQNIVSDIMSYSLDGVQENSQDQLHQEACRHGVPMAVVETSDDMIEMTQNQVYGVPLASAAGQDSITILMEANVCYRSHQEGSPQDEGSPLDEKPPQDDGNEYDYIKTK